MEIKKYNIKGSKWYSVKLYLIDGNVVDAKCDCVWGINNQNAWKEGRSICKHISEGVRQYYLEKRKKKPTVEGFKKLPKWLRKKYLNEIDYCQHCGSKTRLEIHRIKRGNKGGLYTNCKVRDRSSNVMVLCRDCHQNVHGDEIGTL